MHFNLSKPHRGTKRSIHDENRAHEYMHPLRDWAYVLGFCTTVFVLGVGYVAYEYYVQFGISNDAFSTEGKIVKYRDGEVTALADEYAEHDALFAVLRGNQPLAPEEPVEVEVVASSSPITPLAEDGAPLYTEDAPTLSP